MSRFYRLVVDSILLFSYLMEGIGVISITIILELRLVA
jgi:hypothetical protein